MMLFGRYKVVGFQNSRTKLAAFFVALVLASFPFAVQAATRYVDPVNGNNAGNCDVLASPCKTITYALGAAAAGDDIKLAKGIYTEPEITISKAVTLTGGFDPANPATTWNTSTYTLTPSILDGENARRLLYINADDVVLQYLTVRNGNADSGGASLPARQGGGILVNGADDVVLRGLTIMNNVASATNPDSIGGGIAMIGTSDVDILQTLIFSNTSAGLGGGVGINPATGQLAIFEARSTVIAHNAALEGGAVATTGDGRSVLSFYHSTFGDNDKGPGADEAFFMTNGNNAQANSILWSYDLLIGNNTVFRSNTDVTPQVLSTGVMIDTTVANDWEGNVPVLNPATQRPLAFVNREAGDYHLVAGSPAIDIAGNTQKIDLEGRKRPIGSSCTPFTLCPLGLSDDYGAYEYVRTAPTIYYVANGGTDNTNNCMNPDLPCATLENANKISLGGDEIRLAQGTYTDGDSACANSAVICMRQGITLTGGFTTTNWTTPSSDPTLTVLDGTDQRRGIMVDYDAPSGSSLIRNLTVRNGKSFANGGGIAINSQNVGPTQNVTLRNCLVEGNDGGAGDGGGLFANKVVNLQIESCTFANNYVSDGRGGGLSLTDDTGTMTYTLTNLTIYGNFADRPDENSANGGMGGGVFLQGVGTLRQSEIYSNSAAFSGGGVTTGSNNAHPTIDRVYIHDNQASLGGGFSIFLTGGANLQNSLLARNAATSTVGLITGQTSVPMMGGNAIHSPYVGVPDEPLRVINVTIADNHGAVNDAVKVEGSANVGNSRLNEFINVLISGNEVGIRSDGMAVAQLTKVLITNDVTTPLDGFDPARLTGTPLSGAIGFVGGGDYHLKPDADGVDDGDAVPGITHDLDGVVRPVGPAVDIGAYETSLQKENQTITFAAIGNRALAQSPFTVNPIASSGLPVQLSSKTPSVCTVSGFEVTLVAEGTCTLEATQPGNTAFNPAPSVTRSFQVVSKLSQTINFPSLKNRALADSPFTVTATASSGLPVTLTSLTPTICTVSGFEVTLVDVGRCSIEATQAGNSLYHPAPVVTRSFDIGIDVPQIKMNLPLLYKQ